MDVDGGWHGEGAPRIDPSVYISRAALNIVLSIFPPQETLFRILLSNINFPYPF
jgi:hypothetical protein